MEKIEVLFIGGFGRSGSTLIDNVLGQIEGVFSIGELRFIWDRGLNEHQLCGCQKTLYNCEIWDQILKEAFGTITQEFIHELIQLSQYIDKPKNIPRLLLKYDKRYNTRKKEYQNYLMKIYQAVKVVTGANLIVDSSKTPSHGMIINQIDILNVKTLHLVRDPRAVTYSWKKKKLRPEITEKKENMPRYNSIRSVIWWFGSNIFTQILASQSQDRFFSRYEDFCKDPDNFVNKIIISYEKFDFQITFISNKDIRLNTTHTVAGNPSRFKIGLLSIKEDNEWKKNLDKPNKFLVTLFSFPLLLKYKYKIIE